MLWAVNATTRPLYLRERPGTDRVGGWVSPRASLDKCGKFALSGCDPRIVQPVTSPYTDYAISALCIKNSVNVKESRNRTGVVQRVPGGLGSQIFMTFGT